MVTTKNSEKFNDEIHKACIKIDKSGFFDDNMEKKYSVPVKYIIKKIIKIFEWYCNSRGVCDMEYNTISNMEFYFTPELEAEMQRVLFFFEDGGREGYWEWLWQCIVEGELKIRRPGAMRNFRGRRVPPSF